MDCTQPLVESDEEDDFPKEDDRRQVAFLNVNEVSLPIFLGENKIGRDSASCSVVIDNTAISGQHAVIQGLECGMFIIYDLNSTNKTKIGKMTLVPNVRYQLKSGDDVRFANVSCTFYFERKGNGSDSSSTEHQRDDFPLTQVIEVVDNEEGAVEEHDSNEQDTIDGNCSSVKDPDENKIDMKALKTIIKRPEEHLFKMPAPTPPRHINDSSEYMNASKDLSCHVDSDDEIFDLLTQPANEEPESSDSMAIKDNQNNRGPSSGDLSSLNGERALKEDEITDEEDIFSAATEDIHLKPKESNDDEDDIFSAATENFAVELKKKGMSDVVLMSTGNNNSGDFDENELTDEENIFSAATQDASPKSNKKKVSNTSSRVTVVTLSDALKEDEITDEEDIFSAATEDIHLKPKEKSTHKLESNDGKDTDAWEEYGIADEDEIFSAATDGLPSKPSKNIPEKSEIGILAEGSDTSKEGGVADGEDIFSASTEALPVEPTKKNISNVKLRDTVTKIGDDVKEDEVTDEEDIFSAATEGFTGKWKKTLPHASHKNSCNLKEGEVCSEMQGPHGMQLAEAAKTKSDDMKNILSNQENIFSASTEGLPLSHGDKNKDEGDGFISNSVDVKEVQGKEENCDNEGFVKDLLSTSDSEHLCGERDKPSECKMMATVNEPGNSQSRDFAESPLQGGGVAKLVEREMKVQEIIKPEMEKESDGDETDVEDEILDSSTKERKIQHNYTVKKMMKESCSESEKSNVAKSDIHLSHEESILKCGLDEDGDFPPKVPNTSFVVISDTDDEDEEENYINSTMENSKENKTLKSSTVGSNSSRSNKSADMTKNELLASKILPEVSSSKQSENETTSVLMTIDETLPATHIIVTKQGKKSSAVHVSQRSKDDENAVVDQLKSLVGCDNDKDESISYSKNTCKTKYVHSSDSIGGSPPRSESLKSLQSGNEGKENEDSGRQKMNEPNAQGEINSQTPLTNIKNDACDKSQISVPGEMQNKSAIIVDDDEEELFVTETPVCVRNVKRQKGFQFDHKEDMNSFLTQAPPEFKTPEGGTKILDAIEDDLGESKRQPASVSSDTHTPCKGKNESNEEDMSSFLTEAPPEFKTPVAGVRKIIAEEEEDLSDLATQPAPRCEEKEHDTEEEDMSSFLTQAPPDFKTPLTGVRKIIAEEEEDLSDLATQPAPRCEEKEHDAEEEDMSSFLTQAPPDFKTPLTGVRKIIAEEEEDLSDLATQPAPRSEEKEHDAEEEDMSSFLTEAPPEFKTPVAGVRKIIAEEEEDLSDLATQPAPRCEEKEHNDEEEEEDLSDLATQPAPRCEEKEHDTEEEDMSSFLTQAPPDFKTPLTGVRKIIAEEEEDLSDLATQPAPRCEEKEHDAEEEDMSSFLTQAPPDFKTPVAGVRKIIAEEEEDLSDLATQPAPRCEEKEHNDEEEEEDLSDLATQPAPRCEEKEHNDEEEDMSSFLTQAPPDFKTPLTGVRKIISEEEEDLSDLATQPAPRYEEKGTKAPLESTTCDGQKMHAGEEEDLSELETQPAPSSPLSSQSKKETLATQIAKKSSAIQVKKELDSEEEDLSLLDTQPAPCSQILNKLAGELKKGRPLAKDQIRDGVSMAKAPGASSSKESESLRGKSYHSKQVESPRKACTSKTVIKVSDILSGVEAQIEEENTGSDIEFSIGLPDTPELSKTLQESGTKFLHPHTSCKNLFNLEKSSKCSSVSTIESLKGVSKEEVFALSRSEKSAETVQKEPMKRNVIKVSKIAKATLDEKSTVYPPKELEGIQYSRKRSGHMNLKGKDSGNDSKMGFARETQITMVGLSNMQKRQNSNVEKCKSLRVPLLREVVVTSTPIHMCGVSSELGVTPPGSSTDTLEEKASKKSTRRGRRKVSGAKGGVVPVDTAKDVIAPVVFGGDADKMSSYIKIEDAPLSRVHNVQKSHNLRSKKLPESCGEVKAVTRRSKETKLNVLTSTETLQVEESNVGSLNLQGMCMGRKRKKPSEVEVASVAKASAKVAKCGKKNEFDEGSPVSSKNQTKLADCTEKPSKSNESYKGEYMVDTSESSNVDLECSPVMFYGKHHETLKCDSSAIGRTKSSVDMPKRKKALGSATQSQSENRNTSAASPDPVRRSERGRKPKKQFSVDSSPIKTSRNKSELKSLDSIPVAGKTVRGGKGVADSCTFSDSGMNSSRETAISSDGTGSTSKKRASDDDQSLRSSKRLRTSGDDGAVKVVTRGDSRRKVKEDSSTLKRAVGSPGRKSREVPKLVAQGSDLGKGATIARDEKGDSQVVQNVRRDDDGHMDGRACGRRRRMEGPKVPGVSPNTNTLTKVNDKTGDPKQAPDQHTTGKMVSQRLKEGGSTSEKSQVTTTKEGNSRVNQDGSLREGSVASVRTSRKRKNELTSANSSKVNVSSLTTEVCGESKDAKSDGSTSGGNATTSRGSRRRKTSPVLTVGSTEKGKGNVAKVEHPPSPKVIPPLRISRSRIIPESVKVTDAVTLGSPVFSESILVGKHTNEEKPTRARKQKKATICVLFTGLNDLKLNQIVERLGGSVVETPQSCTVLVTDRLRRTYKLLCAIARGIPIVTVQWLTQSSSSSRFLDPMDFLVNDKVTEKRFDFALKSSLEKAREKPILSGYSFIATPSVKPPPEEVQGIVTCAGGQYISSLKSVEGRLTHLLYVVSCVEDSAIWDEYTEIGVKRGPRGRAQRGGKLAVTKEEAAQTKLVGVEGLLVSVLRQKVDFKHEEFSLR